MILLQLAEPDLSMKTHSTVFNKPFTNVVKLMQLNVLISAEDDHEVKATGERLSASTTMQSNVLKLVTKAMTEKAGTTS